MTEAGHKNRGEEYLSQRFPDGGRRVLRVNRDAIVQDTDLFREFITYGFIETLEVRRSGNKPTLSISTITEENRAQALDKIDEITAGKL